MALPALPALALPLCVLLALPGPQQRKPKAPLPTQARPIGARLALSPSAVAHGYGHSVVNLGDLDGDGFDDFAAGAPAILLDQPGHVVVHSGRTGRQLWRVHGDDPRDEFGYALAALDWNGDGNLDLVVGARRALVAGKPRGVVRVFEGRVGSELTRFEGGFDHSDLGAALARVGDLNGDGRADLAVGAPGEADDRGAVYVFAAGSGQMVRRFAGQNSSDLFGWAIAPVGDVDRDGIADVAVGAPGRDARGPAAGMVSVMSGANGRTIRSVLGRAGGERLGSVLAALPDLDGDGVADFAAAAPWAALGEHPDVGRVDLISSRDGSVLGELRGTRAGQFFGRALVSLDADGDGNPDLAVGVPYADNPLEPSRHRPGAVSIYRLSTRELISSRAASLAEERHGYALAALQTPKGMELLVGAPHREETLPPSDNRRKGWVRTLPFAER